MNRQCAPFQPAEFAERELGGVDTRQHRPGFREEDSASFRQLDAAPDPIEELRIMPRLQGCDGVARSGLREIQRASGVRDVLSLGPPRKYEVAPESHRSPANGTTGRLKIQSDL